MASEPRLPIDGFSKRRQQMIPFQPFLRNKAVGSIVEPYRPFAPRNGFQQLRHIDGAALEVSVAAQFEPVHAGSNIHLKAGRPAV